MDLDNMGLITSEEKCVRTPTQLVVWCGFMWSTEEFTVSVTEGKVTRIKQLAAGLLEKSKVTVREVAALTGLVISFTPALGRMDRFR